MNLLPVHTWHRLGAWWRYIRRAKTRYGLHSPFVYALTDKCLYDKQKYPAYDRLKAYRRMLRKDPTPLPPGNWGAGTSAPGGMRVKDLARRAASPLKQAKLWYRLARYSDARRVLELGTHLGMGTLAWSLGTRGEVVSVEGDPARADYARKKLKEFGITNARIVHDSFDRFLENDRGPWDIVFIDGDHTYEATLRYFRRLKESAGPDTLLIFHDIHWSPEMERAWTEIVADPDMHVTVDLFCCGLVWKRPRQYKEHFIIRF